MTPEQKAWLVWTLVALVPLAIGAIKLFSPYYDVDKPEGAPYKDKKWPHNIPLPAAIPSAILILFATGMICKLIDVFSH